MKLVLVEWEDASDVDAGPWVDRATAPEPEPVIFVQVGFLYRLTAREVVLTACVGRDTMGVRSRIPAGMVRRLIELEPAGLPLAIPKKRKGG